MNVSQALKQDVFSVRTAARDFFAGQISEWTLRSWIRTGKLAAFHAGARVLLRREDLERLCKPHTTSQDSNPDLALRLD